MKEKYVLEKYPRWFVFGASPDGKTVDVSNGQEDVLTGIPPEQAERAISEHNTAIDALVEQMTKSN